VFSREFYERIVAATIILVFLARCTKAIPIASPTHSNPPPLSQPVQPQTLPPSSQPPDQPTGQVNKCSEKDISPLGVLRSTDHGATWTSPGHACMRDLNIKPVDPTCFSLDGRIVLYLVDLDSLGKPVPQSIYRATSMDGVNFDTPQPVYTQTITMVDPFVLPLADGSFRLYTPSEEEGIISALSTNGAEFKREEGARFQLGEGGMPGGLLLPDGRVRMFLNGVKDGQPGIFSMISEDGLNFTPEPGLRILGSGETIINDAQPIRITNGGYLMLYQGLPGNMMDQPNPPSYTESYLASSTDGFNWVTNPDKVVNSGTSCISEMPDGTLYIYYGS